ncbi:MAG: ATP-binding protein [Gemmataceae bacterium]
MSAVDGTPLENRVLVLAPTDKDAELSRTIFKGAGIECAFCRDLAEVRQEQAAGAAVAVLTEEALGGEVERLLIEELAKQPPWSDFPIIVLTRGGADSPAALRALDSFGNVTLLERPVRVTTLISAVRAALRARERQYILRDYLAERERINAALREGDRRKDEFLAMLAHELRNPLAPVRNALQILRIKCGDDPVVKGMAEIMSRQVAHMVRLVDDLLDISRITRGKIELRKEVVDVASIVARAVESQRSFLEERQHKLEVALPSEALWIAADPARLEQILTNLLSNAAKYTEPGGCICLTARSEGEQIVLSVRDNGIGIRAEMLPFIFDMFTQGDRVPGCLQEGLGLGLALVRSLVELHGGTVTASSAGLGRGSEFKVRLPAFPAKGQPRTVPPLPTPRRREKIPLKILIVDDNVDGATSLAMLLKLTGGCEVEVTHDGPTALQVARAFRPEVVLLDIGLPKGMDGYEVAKRLRQDAQMENAFLIALTGFGQEEHRRRTQAAGFNAHWVKPVNPDKLQEMLSEIVQRRLAVTRQQ